jgi:hypothetical protein
VLVEDIHRSQDLEKGRQQMALPELLSSRE